MLNNEKEYYKNIGAKIRELREGKKLRQRDIADKLGISSAYFSRIERGQKCSAFLINRILQEMGYSLDVLTEEQPQTDTAEASEDKSVNINISVSTDDTLKEEKEGIFETLKKLKRIFSPELYDRIAQDIQKEADEKRRLRREATGHHPKDEACSENGI